MKKLIATLAVTATVLSAAAPAQADDTVLRGAIIGAIFGAVIADANRSSQPVYQPHPVYQERPVYQDRPVYRDQGYYNRHNDPRRPNYTRGYDTGRVCKVTSVPRGNHRFQRIEQDCYGNIVSVDNYRR